MWWLRSATSGTSGYFRIIYNGNIDNLMIAEIDESIYIKQLIIKKRFDLQDMDEKEKKKLYDFLLRRGFSYGIIKDTIKNFDDI